MTEGASRDPAEHSSPVAFAPTLERAKGGTPIMLAALDLQHSICHGRARVSFHPVAPMLRAAGVPDTLALRLEPAQRQLVEALRS